MDVNTALQEVLKTALIHDGLSRDIREAAKALDKLMTTRSLVSGWVSARLTERASPARLLVAVALSSRIMARNPQAKDVIEEYLEAKK